MRYLLCVLTLSFLSHVKLAAQADWDYLFKEQYERAVELFNHHYYNKAYKHALPHLEWMINERPGESASQYMMGIDLYEKLAQDAEDTEEKYRYTQLALKLYDERMQHFGDTITLLNRKFSTAYKLLYKDSTHYEQLYTLGKEVLEQTGQQFAYYNFVPHAFLLSQMQKKGNITEEEVKTDEVQLSTIANYHTQEQGNSWYEEAMLKVKKVLSEP